MGSNARSNLSDQSKRWADEKDKRLADLERRLSLIESLDPNTQLNRLSTAVGNSATKTVPVWIPETLKLAGTSTNISMPNFDSRYDWAVFSGTIYGLSELSAAASFSNQISADAWWSGDSFQGKQSSVSGASYIPSTLFPVSQLAFTWTFDLRTVEDNDYTWFISLQDDSVFRSDFLPGINSYFTLNSVIRYSKENS